MAALAALIIGAFAAYNMFAGREDSALVLPAGNGGAAGIRLRAPDFAMTNRDGESVTLSGIIDGGKPVVLNFWASWCPACRNESPVFQKVFEDIGSEVKFVKLNLVDGARETVASGKRYIDDGGFTFPVYFDTKQEGLFAYGIRSIPATFFIDRDGYIVTRWQGSVNEAALRMGIDLIR